MFRFFKKYQATFNTQIKNTFVYRGMLIIWMIGWLLSFLTSVFLWNSAQTKGSLAGFTKDQIISYYFIGMFVWQVVGWFPFYTIIEKIRNGEISNMVIKPINFYWYMFVQELAWHVVNTFIFSLLLFFIFFLVRANLFLQFQLSSVFLFILALAIAAFIVFGMSMILSTLAFWLIRAQGVASLFWILLSLLGGQMLPLRFFPSQYQTFINITPFRFMYSFPIEILLEDMGKNELIYSFSLGIFWVIFFYWLFHLLWQRGLKNFTAWGS